VADYLLGQLQTGAPRVSDRSPASRSGRRDAAKLIGAPKGDRRDVRDGSFASFWPSAGYFWSSPVSRHAKQPPACLKRAISGRLPGHSITAFASASTLSGISRPIAFAVLTLMTSSNLVGCSTGRSAGFAPFAILSTYSATRRKMAGTSGP
jgi:hypothetical protein